MAEESWATLYDQAAEELTPLPNGDYDFEVTTSNVKTASTGKTMYVIKAQVTDGPNAKKSCWHNFVVSKDSPEAMQIFFRNMDALGLSRDFWRTNPSDDDVVKALKGRRFRGTTKLRTYQGQERPEFQRMTPLGSGGGFRPGSAPPPPPGASAPPPPPTAPVAAPPAPPVAEAPAAPPAPPAPPAEPAPAPAEPEPTTEKMVEETGAPVTPATPPPPPPAAPEEPSAAAEETSIPAPPPPPSF